MEMLRNECSEELEELRRNENQPQGQEQNIAINQEQALENPTLEVDETNNVERMPYRVSEWFILMDRNRERKAWGLNLFTHGKTILT